MNLLVHLRGSVVEEGNPKQKGWIERQPVQCLISIVFPALLLTFNRERDSH
jgi:hypothetical protein